MLVRELSEAVGDVLLDGGGLVVGLGEHGDDIAAKLDKQEDGWKISGKYVSHFPLPTMK